MNKVLCASITALLLTGNLSVFSAANTYTDLDFTAKDRAGVYRRKLQTVEHGCDSIVTLYLAANTRYLLF